MFTELGLWKCFMLFSSLLYCSLLFCIRHSFAPKGPLYYKFPQILLAHVVGKHRSAQTFLTTLQFYKVSLLTFLPSVSSFVFGLYNEARATLARPVTVRSPFLSVKGARILPLLPVNTSHTELRPATSSSRRDGFNSCSFSACFVSFSSRCLFCFRRASSCSSSAMASS